MSRARKPSDVSGNQRALRADTAERVEAIVEAAERAAESVIDDAEAQAHRYLAQARAEADRLVEGRASGLAELIDTLLGQATSLRQEAERLQAALEGAKALIEADEPTQSASQQESPQEPEQPEVPRLRAVAPPEDPQQGGAERRSNAAGARLLATQLAVSGSSREEIAQRLRNGFEIEDTDAILDAILGPEEQ
jgi:cell division septum initiation protein DivIVA